MTREEEFKCGAKWADEHLNLCKEEQVGMNELGMMWQKQALIKKACEWLKKELIDNRDNFGYNVVSSFDTFTLSEFIEEFKKAMEG